MSRYLTFDPDVYFPEQRENYLRLEFALGVHVLCGMLALLIGPFQFVRRLRRRFVRVHRVCGAVYVASATGLGVTGLILAPTAYTGLGASVAFTLLALATLFTTWTALRMVLAGRYAEHRRWMIRSFSLIMAGVMLRVWAPALRRARRGRARRLLLRDRVRRDRLAVLGAESADRALDHPPTRRPRTGEVIRLVWTPSFVLS